MRKGDTIQSAEEKECNYHKPASWGRLKPERENNNKKLQLNDGKLRS